MVLLTFACNKPASQTDVNEVLEADKSFSALCLEKGMEEAFLTFAAEDVIKLQSHEPTIRSKKELRDYFKKNPENAAVKFGWEPLKADVSGDLGYTFGQCTITLPPDSLNQSKNVYLNYVTVWKKQRDGSWKFQTDGGNMVPALIEKN